MTPDPRYSDDHQLARRVVNGSEPHWHQLVERYTPLIRSVARRYLHDEDDVRTVWTAVLEQLRDGLLDQFQGQSSLATWLVFVVRSRACDHLRRVRGRRRLPPKLEGSPELLIACYEELFIQGRGAAEVTHRLRRRGLLAADRSLAEVVAEIEDRLGADTLQNVAFDLQADQVGLVSGRLLEYLDQVTADAAVAGEAQTAAQREHAEETRQTLDRIQAIVADLPDTDRRVVQLRYRRGWTAPRIARLLGLNDTREVYTISDRVIRRIRNLFGISSLLVFLFFFGGRS